MNRRKLGTYFEGAICQGNGEVLLLVADGLSGLSGRVKKYYPPADSQPCAAHAAGNVITRVGAPDKEEVGKDLAKEYIRCIGWETGRIYAYEFTVKQKDKHPSAVANLNRDRGYLFTHYNYPESIGNSIGSTDIT